MSDPTGAPAGDIAAPANQSPEISLSEARAMIDAQLAEPAPAERAEPDKPATAEKESASQEADADPETAPSEEPEAAEPDASPPIEPPRSWTKAEKERFQSLPRETQEYLHTREQERDRDFRRSQNEIAEQRKAIETERSKAEEVRKQYEAQLPALMQELQNAQQSAYADIRTVDDVTKLANEDPFRYLQWQAHQTKLQAVNAENERARGDKSRAEQEQWAQHVQKQNELAAEYIPELADKIKGPALTQRAADRLHELGFKPEELASLASGKEKLSLYDHRVQRLIFSDLKLSDIQSATKAVAKPDLPPVQKPGVARPSGQADSEHIQALEAKLTKSGSIRDAEALLNARLSQESRRRA
jgi:hypothetical protein